MSTKDLTAEVGWKFWQAARLGREFNIPAGFVPIGFYRLWNRHREKSWPVAIWVSAADGKKRAQVGGAAPIDLTDPAAEEDFDFGTFKHCCRNAITFETHQNWMQTRTWDQDQPQDLKPAGDAPGHGKEEVGGNSGGTGHEQIKDQALSVLELCADVKKITTQAEAESAQGYRERLSQIANEADKLREAEKKPHWDAGKAVDAKWNGEIIRPAQERSKELRLAIEDFVRMEKARERAAAAEIEKAGMAGAAPAANVVSIQGRNRKAKVVTVRDGRIIDQDKLYFACRNTPEFVAKLREFVTAIYATGATLPGCELVEDVRVR